GLGDDFLHGGAGDDAISGAEAVPTFYTTAPVTNFNPLQYDPATRKFAAYDANNPRQKIANFLLNFEATTASGQKIDDGKDSIFGDLGHDWLVGGTRNDRLFGGLGDDLLNADDNHDTNGGLNNRPDAPQFADADFAFGGGGLDVLIANTGADRLFDWTGEFNTFLVPFSPFGYPTIIRSPSPHVFKFLTELGRASGADRSLQEPNGELGLVTQKDPQWNDQHGAPRDPQAGNIPGVQRDTQGRPEDDSATGGYFGNQPFEVIRQATYTSSDPSRLIPDEGQVLSSLLITDTGEIRDLNVVLTINHPRSSDLVVTLRNSEGIVIELLNQVGGSGNDLNGITLDDEATLPINAVSSNRTRIFRPEGDLRRLEGLSITGTWTLEVRDVRKKNVGTLVNWSLVATIASLDTPELLAGASMVNWVLQDNNALPSALPEIPSATSKQLALETSQASPLAVEEQRSIPQDLSLAPPVISVSNLEPSTLPQQDSPVSSVSESSNTEPSMPAVEQLIQSEVVQPSDINSSAPIVLQTVESSSPVTLEEQNVTSSEATTGTINSNPSSESPTVTTVRVLQESIPIAKTETNPEEALVNASSAYVVLTGQQPQGAKSASTVVPTLYSLNFQNPQEQEFRTNGNSSMVQPSPTKLLIGIPQFGLASLRGTEYGQPQQFRGRNFHLGGSTAFNKFQISLPEGPNTQPRRSYRPLPEIHLLSNDRESIGEGWWLYIHHRKIRRI
ncbi:MAG: proprotein convertase P-domain-containing protein, partial [Oculatellaceae cyanobacterium bins.114]|nr:proprotein convertase P-domain-containing protein [Oculatellaceae cyanobacterium bins.114]